MKQLSIEDLSPASSDYLESQQDEINQEITFQGRTEKAGVLWNKKNGTNNGRAAFTEIRTKLVAACVGVEICNYCENNEATDIEHIFPKSHFPDKTFLWGNYLLACKICNTTYKSDNFRVFVATNNDNYLDLKRGGAAPPSDDSVLLNPREENPMDFILLDITGTTFRFVVNPNCDERGRERARYTIELLALNSRDALVAGRKAAASYLVSRLEKYVQIKEALSLDGLAEIVTDTEFVHNENGFEAEKIRLMDNVKREILHYSHPTVWKELQRQRKRLNKTGSLFNRAPEALEW